MDESQKSSTDDNVDVNDSTAVFDDTDNSKIKEVTEVSVKDSPNSKNSFSVDELTGNDNIKDKIVEDVNDLEVQTITKQSQIEECVESLLFFAAQNSYEEMSSSYLKEEPVYDYGFSGFDVLLEGIEKLEQPCPTGFGSFGSCDGLNLLCYLTRNDTFEYDLHPSISR